MNYNVKLSYWWTLFENVSGSIRSGDALSAYIYLLTQKNSVVGYIQGINGIAQLLVAFPAGYLSDKHRRDTVLRCGAAIGALAGLCLLWAILYAHAAWAIALAMALLGSYRGLYNPSLEALFADSVETGRSSPYSWRYIIMISASGMGPLLSLFVFLWLGNEWLVGDCRSVVAGGLALMVVPLALMTLFDDDKALGHHSEATTTLLPRNHDADTSSNNDTNFSRGDEGGWSPSVIIAVLITVSDFFGALASGMTLKFFSLFFMQRVSFSPVSVSLLSTMSPLAVSLASFLAQRASKTTGRVTLSLFTRALDIALLVAMAQLPTTTRPAHIALVATHLVRMAAANCTRPLIRSVLMQHVKKKHRGKVNAIDSIRAFSWSGSAALGGILVERYGFEATFMITAAVKAVAFVPMIALMGYVDEGWGLCCLTRRRQQHQCGGENGYEPLPAVEYVAVLSSIEENEQTEEESSL